MSEHVYNELGLSYVDTKQVEIDRLVAQVAALRAALEGHHSGPAICVSVECRDALADTEADHASR